MEEQELRMEINEQLQKVNKNNAPKIYKKLQTQEGYLEIEAKIINMIIVDMITPSACIPQIEVEL